MTHTFYVWTNINSALAYFQHKNIRYIRGNIDNILYIFSEIKMYCWSRQWNENDCFWSFLEHDGDTSYEALLAIPYLRKKT